MHCTVGFRMFLLYVWLLVSTPFFFFMRNNLAGVYIKLFDIYKCSTNMRKFSEKIKLLNNVYDTFGDIKRKTTVTKSGGLLRSSQLHAQTFKP